MNRRGRPSRRLNIQRTLTSLRAKQRNEKGGKVNLSPDPKSFAQVPWWPITIQDLPSTDAKGVKRYACSDVASIFTAQTGLPFHLKPAEGQAGFQQLSFRLLQIEVWSRTTAAPITLEVQDLTIGFGTNDYIFQHEDMPAWNQYARVAYKVPYSQSLVILAGSDTESLFDVTSAASSKIIVRMRLLWKMRVLTTPNIERPIDLEQRVKALEEQLSKSVIISN